MGSSTGFFEKYAAFGALLTYLFDFSVFFMFLSGFGALLMVHSNFVDVFLMIFQLLYEFRGFWMDLIQNFMYFCRVPIEDFRRFSQISSFSTVFVHRFEHFKEAKVLQMRSF